MPLPRGWLWEIGQASKLQSPMEVVAFLCTGPCHVSKTNGRQLCIGGSDIKAAHMRHACATIVCACDICITLARTHTMREPHQDARAPVSLSTLSDHAHAAAVRVCVPCGHA